MKILLVDDDLDVLESLTHLAETYGHEVTAATNVQAALAILATVLDEDLDLVVTDYDLRDPHGTGADLVGLGKRYGLGAKFVLMSGLAREDTGGADLFVSKGNFDALVEVLK